MNKKLTALKLLKNMLVQQKEEKKYYSIKEKKKMILKGEDVPVCAYDSKSKSQGIVPLRHVPNEHIKKLKFKI